MSADLVFNSGSARSLNTLLLTSLSYQEQSIGFLHLPCPSTGRPEVLKEPAENFSISMKKNNLSPIYYHACHVGSGLKTPSIPPSLPLPPFVDHCVTNPCHFGTWSDKFPYVPLNTANSNKSVSYRGLISFGNILKKATTFYQPFSVQPNKTPGNWLVATTPMPQQLQFQAKHRH